MSDDELTATGKYLLLQVPNFNQGDPALHSFLRLGAAATGADAEAEPGKDLAEMFSGFIDDTRQRTGWPHPVDHPEVSDRQAETAKLLTKGGWRDHSDGNRVSTTRGDKVEIVRGNYQMLVLGRQDDPNDAAGWDASGGHIQDMGLAPGGIVKIEWVQNYDGTWKVTEEAQKGDTHTIYHGDMLEEFYGKSLTSITGAEDPTASVDATQGDAKKTNPTIVERTWAQSIESYTGSETTPVPSITEKTWATTMVSQTGSEAKHVSSMTESTWADTITSQVGSSGHEASISDTIYASSVTETLHCSGQHSTEEHATTFKERRYGVTDAEYHGHAGEQWYGNFSELFIGGQESFRLAGSAECTVGAGVEAYIGGSLELFIGKTVELLLGSRIDIQLGSCVELRAGPKFEAATSDDVKLSSATKTRKALAILLG